MRAGGFTLIELLVVIVIIGILMVVAAGTLGREWGVGGRSARQQVIATIEQARGHAIARGVSTAVVFGGEEQDLADRFRKISYLEVRELESGGFVPAEENGALVARWLRLPKGMLFLPNLKEKETVFDIGDEVAGVRQDVDRTLAMTALVFGSRGQLLEPREDVWIYLARGTTNASGGVQRFGGEDEGYQRILVHRLTGRAKGIGGR